MKDRNLFIVFEGLDGAGTTTQAKMLVDDLSMKSARPVFGTFEPSDMNIGVFIRQWLKSDIAHIPDWKTMALLFSADRQYHYDLKIQPYLQGGCDIVCDRYTWSTMAYQGAEAARGMLGQHWYYSVRKAVSWIEDLSKLVQEPDLTIYLDVPPDEAQRRVNSRGGIKEAYEVKEVQLAIYEVYRLLCSEARLDASFVSIDGTRSIKEIHERCLEAVSIRRGFLQRYESEVKDEGDTKACESR